MRLLLAAAGLVVTLVQPSSAPLLTLFSASAYLACAVVLYSLAGSARVRRISGWLDVAACTLLIALSGTRTLFVFSLLFPILIGALRGGVGAGLRITFVATALAAVAGGVTIPRHTPEWSQFLAQAAFLMVIGSAASYSADAQLTVNRRLRVLRDVTTLSNPRFGVDRTIGRLMQRLRAFYDAEACLIVTAGAGPSQLAVRRSTRQSPDDGNRPLELPHTAAAHLLALPPDHAAVHHESRRRRRIAAPGKVKEKPAGDRYAQLAAVLDARSFITVPWRQHGRPAGRLYLTSDRPARFGAADIEFLNQVIDQVSPTLDNIRLVDRLATDAADAERQRIARDLHDNVVQPYIGIRMGLAAMRQKLRAHRDVSSDVEQLDDMIGFEIEELRRYLSGLKRRDARSTTFADGLRRFAARFSEATGIEVRVEMPADLQVDDRLAAETFQIVVEALANVRRHTESTDVRVTLDSRVRHLFVRVEDTGIPGQPGGGFRPLSIAERAEALGGRVRVEPRAGSGTVMAVEIPL